MNYKIKSLYYLGCLILACLAYEYYDHAKINEEEYASLEEIKNTQENLKRISAEILKNLDY